MRKMGCRGAEEQRGRGQRGRGARKGVLL